MADRPRGRRRLRVVAFALLPVVLVGCTSTRTVRMRLDPPTAATRMQSGEASVRVAAVTLDDGSRVEFADAGQLGPDGVVRGAVADTERPDGPRHVVEIPWERVREVSLEQEERRFSPLKTAGLVVGVLVAAYAGFVAWVVAEEAKR